eukprot:CAMPEP_0170175742 /NCGR_PEP_ID=MMETSP0040_2-20121228/8771_1 /TAXON_ID=641309 /ORGANISM="Lotharella oceanica, Strain CCMP622" /LENGTH=89 /DNA_ID=CAMNT_0010417837 /DNA_START=252 /DNA_END=519 /DNA_ORIENTATION=-
MKPNRREWPSALADPSAAAHDPAPLARCVENTRATDAGAGVVLPAPPAWPWRRAQRAWPSPRDRAQAPVKAIAARAEEARAPPPSRARG